MRMPVKFPAATKILFLDLVFVCNQDYNQKMEIFSNGEPPVSRAVEKYAKARQEKEWLNSTYEEPSGISGTSILKDLSAFEKLIWDYPKNDMLPVYDHTPDEMAALCSEGETGWLSSSHIEWIFNLLNGGQRKVLNFCTSMTTPDVVRMMTKEKGNDLERFNLVLNVGKNMDGSVFIGSPRRSGNHWVLVSVDLQCCPATVLYCDSLGWDRPTDLIEHVTNFTAGLVNERPRIIMMHSPTKGAFHQCSKHCTNYPLQTCSNVCGVVAVVCAAISTLNEPLFVLLCGHQGSQKLFLSEPTRYDRYLRRVLIFWFISGHVSTSLLQPKNIHVALDHCYSETGSVSAPKRKRSHGSFAECPVKMPCFAELIEPNNSRVTLDHCYVKGSEEYFSESSSPELATGVTSTAGKIEMMKTESPEIETKVSAGNVFGLAKKSDKRAVQSGKKDPSLGKCHHCPICQKLYRSLKSLSEHKKKKHSIQSKPLAARSCQCSMCPFRGKSVKNLIDHYNSTHDKNIEILEKNFDSKQDFINWKSEIELSSSSNFALHRGKIATRSACTKKYYCNRSGTPRSPLLNATNRAPKSQGSRKINNFCTSFLFAKEDLTRHTVSVQYCLAHIGHECELMHLPLSDNVKSQIVGKLSQGLEPSAVLDSFRDDISSINRDSLVTKRDINNLKARNTFSKSKKDAHDPTSVALWVKELADREDNPIIYYKPQNREHDILKNSDFLLCIQTDFQKEMMRKHGSKIICMDSTHCTTQYDYLLITILIIDDFGEAVPVAFAIANREDTQVLSVFMNAVRKSLGNDFTADVFMSDMAENFYVAWCRCFRKPVRKLHCSWHVDRSWRNKLNVHVKDAKVKEDVYTVLKDLQYECDESKFRNLLQKALAYFDKETKEFSKYFQKTYVTNNKAKMWAACFRHGTVANTNMYAESFHNVLKSVYFNRKQNRRVDSLLHVLLKIARDKNIEQIIKLEKGKITYRIQEIKQRHRLGESIEGITKVSDREWTVPSTDKSKELEYSVEKILDAPCKCKLSCSSCFVCIHKYSCSCHDYLLKGVGCKHIHAVHMKANLGQKLNDNGEQDEKDSETLNTLKSYMQSKDKVETSDINKLKMVALRRANDVIQLLTTTNCVDTVRAIVDGLHKTFSSSCGLEKLENRNIVPSKQVIAPNKLFDTQKGFSSTKKKPKKNSKTKLHTVDHEAKAKLDSEIYQTSPKVCALCFEDFDTMSNSDSNFFKCETCECWVHTSCDVQIPDIAHRNNCSVCR